MKDDTPFGVVLIKEGAEAGAASTHETGTLARVSDFYQGSDGLLGITAVGEQRFRIQSATRQTDGLNIAEVERIPAELAMPLPQEFSAMSNMLSNVLDDLGRLYESLHRQLDDAVWVSYRLMEILPVALDTKQSSLESSDTLDRLRLIDEVLKAAGT